MADAKRIKTALISVYHKEGLDEIITKLAEEGVKEKDLLTEEEYLQKLDMVPDNYKLDDSDHIVHLRTKKF